LFVIRLLFICSQNRFRSPTAESVFSSVPGVQAASAGLNHDAPTTVTGDLLAWADVVFVMEKNHLIRLNKRFRPQTRGKEVHVLGIRDLYEYMDPELVTVLEQRVRGYLRGRLSDDVPAV
jgi:predicted protein tyrosine phosphatase